MELLFQPGSATLASYVAPRLRESADRPTMWKDASWPEMKEDQDNILPSQLCYPKPLPSDLAQVGIPTKAKFQRSPLSRVVEWLVGWVVGCRDDRK